MAPYDRPTHLEADTGAQAMSSVDALVADLVSRIVAGDVEDGYPLPSAEELAVSRGMTPATGSMGLELLSTIGLVDNEGENRSSFQIVRTRDLRTVLDHHTAVYQAIRDRDPRASYDVMQAHISHWIGCNVGLVGGLSLGRAGAKPAPMGGRRV